MEAIERPRPLSVSEAARALHASTAYVRRLLSSQRLFGIKVGPVWGIYPQDLESFMRLRRPRGRPPKVVKPSAEQDASRQRMDHERNAVGADETRLKPPRRRRATPP